MIPIIKRTTCCTARPVNNWNSSSFIRVQLGFLLLKMWANFRKLNEWIWQPSKETRSVFDSSAHTVSMSHTFLSQGGEANRVGLLYLSYLLQPMVTAMCLKRFGSQRTDRHQGARGIGALWEMASLWPFWTCQAIFPHVLSSLKLVQRGFFFLPLSPNKDHRAALTSFIWWLLKTLRGTLEAAKNAKSVFPQRIYGTFKSHFSRCIHSRSYCYSR